MPSKFELKLVKIIDNITVDKIECHGIENNWKVFFRAQEQSEKTGNVTTNLRAYTFRSYQSPLIPPVITEDLVTFNPEISEVRGFAYDFTYYIYDVRRGNTTYS